MLVNVVFTENTKMHFDSVVDYRLAKVQDTIICAVICQPVATRSERNAILNCVGEKLFEEYHCDVYVSTDLDVYCDLGRNDLNYNTLVEKMVSRKTLVVTSKL